MRKVAANYIFLPGYPLVKNGYVVLSEERIIDVVDTGGVIKEIQGLEFYGGMIVAGSLVGGTVNWNAGENILPVLERFYEQSDCASSGIAIIQKADLLKLVFTPETVIRSL